MKIHKKTILPLFLLLLICFSELIMDKIHFFYYCDELFAVLFFLVIIFSFIRKREIKNYKKKKRIMIACSIMLVIGVISNVLFGMQSEKIAILLDIVSNFKFPICLIGYSLILDKDMAKDIIKFFFPISKAFIIVSFLCCLISLVFDIGMRGQLRFGIWGYNFIYSYAHIFSMMLLFNLLIVSLNLKSIRNFNIYLIMSLIQLVLTTKGTSIVAVATIIFVMFIIKRNNKLTIKDFALMGVGGIILGNYQIKTYFMNPNTPRSLILKYSIENVKKFFPFGSGFASYGSDMANKYYSNLYKSYGFDKVWGVHQGSLFLNDNYWPMILGQFGIIGFICCIYMLYLFFTIIQDSAMESRPKAIILSCFIYMLIASLGTTIFTTSATIILGFGMVVAIIANGDSLINKKEI